MKLAARMTTLLVLGTLVLIVIAEYITLRHENEHMNKDMREDAAQLAGTISNIVNDVWAFAGPTRAMYAVQRISQLKGTHSVRLVYLDVAPNHPDAPMTQPDELATANHVISAAYIDAKGQDFLCTFSRLSVVERPAAIELAEPVHHDNRNSIYFATHALILMGATTLLGGVMVVAIGGAWIGRPLRRLIEKTRRIGQGDLSTPLTLQRRDEFGELAQALNSMCDDLQKAREKINSEATARVAALDQLRHADRLRTVGRLAAGIAHELGTPLNVVSGRAALISSGRLSDDDVRQSAVIIKSESDRIANIIRQLLDFARRNTPQRKNVELVELTRQTVELLSPIAEKRNCQLQVAPEAPPLMLQVDAGQIQQVLTNLIVNGIESMTSDGSVDISISQQQAEPPEGCDGRPGEYARIDILDQGEGISTEDLEQIFEPFFTTKEVGEGTGLGLSIAYGIVQEHGGWIDVSSELGKGSCFSVYLPIEVAECKDES